VKDPTRPGLLRRLAAIFYDSLLLFALALVVTAALLPLTGGEAIRPGQPAYRILLCLVGFVFFAGFWVHGGQTLGMRAWRLRVVRADGGRLRWRDALARFAAALLSWLVCGLGFLWVLVDRDGLAWHDRLSGTRLVLAQDSAHAQDADRHDEPEDEDGEPADEDGRQLEHGSARGERARADEVREAEQHADHEPLPGARAAQRTEDER
jgi:uncharacterized RDD family membrane protein YckC